MASSIGWVVLDDQHKRDVLEAADFLRESGTVDELGVGVVRDAISDLLFPGTSVLHTRAKYLLFVPWIYEGLRIEGKSGTAAVEAGRRREKQLIHRLIDGDPSAEGIIGKVAQDSLKRLPSESYWAALHRYRVLTWNVSVGGYCNALRRGRRAATTSRDEDGNLAVAGPWNDLPESEDLSSPVTFDLTPDQADYLYGRIETTAPGSMLLWLLDRGPMEATAPWQHPDLLSLTPDQRNLLSHARWFADTAHGAVILYNLMLWEKRRDRAAVASFKEQLAEWHQDHEELYPDGWDVPAFWATVRQGRRRVHDRTSAFLDAWFSRVDSGRVADAGAKDLIRHREYQLKRNLARLTNARALERWSGQSGMDLITYRWGTVSNLSRDIHEARR